jgi:hypothetical protein
MIRKTVLIIGRITACTLLAVSASVCIVANASNDRPPPPVVNGVCWCVCGLAVVLDRQLVRWRKQQEIRV